MKQLPFILCLVLGPAFTSGCMSNQKANPAATQPVTVGDPAEATAEYWLSKPPTDTALASDFDTLFQAAEATAREYLFPIDRRDYRRGLLVTQPVTSKQWFEPWRKDVGTGDDVIEASIGTIRRTIHFQFTPNGDGSFSVAPKVLVERYSRVDAEYYLRFVLLQEPTAYWYALRRDTVLEEKIAAAVRERLKQRG